MSERVVFPLTPTTKPRMTKRSAKIRGGRYFAFRDTVKLAAHGWTPPDFGGWLIFLLELPKRRSRAEKEKLAGTGHMQVPDRDNLEKAFLDCFGQDKQNWDGRTTKLWSLSGPWILHGNLGDVGLLDLAVEIAVANERAAVLAKLRYKGLLAEPSRS